MATQIGEQWLIDEEAGESGFPKIALRAYHGADGKTDDDQVAGALEHPVFLLHTTWLRQLFMRHQGHARLLARQVIETATDLARLGSACCRFQRQPCDSLA